MSERRPGAGVGRAEAEDGDASLVERARAGDATAFDGLVRRHAAGALALARRLVGDAADAEDAVQDAFVAALRGLDGFDTSRRFAPWFYRIVANRCANVREARAVRRTEPLSDVIAFPAAVVDPAERAEIRDRFAAAAAALPESQRLIVELFEVEGWSGAEIAELLDMAPGTVRWHLHEARRTLRRELEALKEDAGDA